MSYKCKLGLISQSFFVLSMVAALSSGTLKAQNPYYSATANSQMSAHGSAPSAQAPAYGSAVSSPTPYGNPGGTGDLSSSYGDANGIAPSAQAQSVPVAPAVGQNVGNDYSSQVVYESAPTYGAGFSTMPEYPRNEAATPSAASTPDPAPEYPQSRDEMVPERVHRNPPLTPYAQQETYSYVTETETSSSTACQLCNEGYGNPYLWQIGAAAKVKHRARQDKGDPVFFNNNGTYAIDSNTSYPISAGVELNMTRYLGRNAFNYDIWCDLSFDGLYEWESEKSVTLQDTVYSNYGIAGLSAVEYNVEKEVTGDDGATTTQTETYNSIPNYLNMKYKCDMNTGEVLWQFRKRGRQDPLVGHPNGTWTRECQGGPRYTHVVGVNYTAYNEDLDWTGTSYIYDASNAYVGTEQGRAALGTENNLLGLMLGGDFVDKHCVWSWGMRWRLAPCLNFMESSMALTNDQGVDYNAKLSETDVAYMAQWGCFTTYKTGKHVIWRLGYDVSCLGNLALAGQNLTVGDSINNNNYNIFQEITLGCTLVW